MEDITTEKLKQYFDNNFDLANFAILIANDHGEDEDIPRLRDLLKTVMKKAENYVPEEDS